MHSITLSIRHRTHHPLYSLCSILISQKEEEEERLTAEVWRRVESLDFYQNAAEGMEVSSLSIDHAASDMELQVYTTLHSTLLYSTLLYSTDTVPHVQWVLATDDQIRVWREALAVRQRNTKCLKLAMNR
jgi:hypothetical protein